LLDLLLFLKSKKLVSILFIIFYIYYLQVNLKVYIILKEIKFIYKLLLNNYIDYIALLTEN